LTSVQNARDPEILFNSQENPGKILFNSRPDAKKILEFGEILNIKADIITCFYGNSPDNSWKT